MKIRHYIYRHKRLDNNQIFYIGIGTKPKRNYFSINSEYSRAYQKTGRSSWWKNIITKTDYEVEIIFEHEDYEFIKEKEKEFIKLYGRKDLGLGTLVNMTDGGDGVIGRITSKDTSIKIKKSNCGRQVSKETRLKQSLAKKGKPMAETTKLLRKGCMPTGENHAGARLLLNTQTGIYYSTLKEAAEAHGKKETTLKNMLTGHRRNKTYIVYAESESNSNCVKVPKIKEYSPIIYTEEYRKLLSLRKKGTTKGEKNKNSIKVIDENTGITYECIKEASEKLCINYKYLCDMLNPNVRKNNKTSLRYL